MLHALSTSQKRTAPSQINVEYFFVCPPSQLQIGRSAAWTTNCPMKLRRAIINVDSSVGPTF